MTIVQNSLIEAVDYNTIQAKVSGVLNLSPSGYGVSPQSTPVTVGTVLTSQHWVTLFNDINRILAHEYNTTATVYGSIAAPTTGTLIRSNFATLVNNSATIMAANTLTVHPSQLASTIVNQVSTRTEAWSSAAPIIHKVNYIWDDYNHMAWFFNLKGYIRPRFDYDIATVVTAEDIEWKNKIDALQSTVASGVWDYTRDQFLASSPQTITQSIGGRSISVTYTRSTQQIEASLQLSTTNDTGINIINTYTTYYSRGDTVPAGIPAPIPSIVAADDFDGGVPSNSPLATKTLIVTPSSLTYNETAESQSSYQTITLANSGNSLLTVTDIQFTNNGVTPVSTASVLLPIVLSPSEESQFDVAYTGMTVGTFSNSITVVSNNDRGNITIPVAQTVIPREFSFTLTPSTVSGTITTKNSFVQKLYITVPYGSYSSYTATVDNANFTIDNSAIDGPVITLNPLLITDGTYSTTVTVTITGQPFDNTISHTSNITVVVDAGLNENIGRWVSALGWYDAVVGMSYDFIGGQRYLTIGVGMGADGSPDLNNGGIPFVSLDNLSFNGDPGFNTGPALYASNPDGAWSSLLKTYGSWVNTTLAAPYNTLIQRSYTITIPSDGYYNWQFSVDNTGFFEIDGGVVGDFQYTTGAYVLLQQGYLYLTAGDHTLTFYANNTGGPGSIAIVISAQTSGNIIWTTRTPVRTSSPYLYWAEVYRIPLESNAIPRSYNIYPYCVKSVGAVFGNSWSDYFGNGETSRSLFTVNDDGYGNLSIAVNALREGADDTGANITLQNLTNSLFYYTELGQRYTNLPEDAPYPTNGQTHLFTGFTRAGTVTTSIVTAPANFDHGGSGGGGSWLDNNVFDPIADFFGW